MNLSSFRSMFSSSDAARGSNGFDPTVQFLRGAAADAQRSRLPQMAAALSYRTIFGLLPVLAVGLWILQGRVSPAEMESLIGRGIDALGLSTIAVDSTAAAAAPGDWIVGPPVPPMTPAPEGTAEATASIKKWITDLVAHINTISFRAIGLVGVGMLIYAAISMMTEIERAFNQVFRVPRGRSWGRRVVNYWALLTLGAIGLAMTFVIQQQLSVRLLKWTGGPEVGSGYITLTIAGLLTQMIITTGVLLILYNALPNTRVRFIPGLIGAATAAAMFEVGKFGFGKYVEFSASTSYARLYGSLALFPLFLLWVYFSWLIVLMGIQLTYQVQHGRARTHAQPLLDVGAALVEPTAALTITTAIARAFAIGHTLDAPAIAQRTRLADPVVRLVLARLTERNLVHRIENAALPGGEAAEPVYSLARPRHSIRIAELLEVGFELAGTGATHLPADGDQAVIARLHRAQIDAAGGETLADIIGTSGEEPAAERRVPGGPTGRTPTLADQSTPLSPALLRTSRSPLHGGGNGAQTPDPQSRAV